MWYVLLLQSGKAGEDGSLGATCIPDPISSWGTQSREGGGGRPAARPTRLGGNLHMDRFPIWVFGFWTKKLNLQWKLILFTILCDQNPSFFPLGRDKTNRNQTGNNRVWARFEKLPTMSSTIMSEATAYSASTLTLAASRKTLSLICRTLLRITARATPTIKLLPIRATSFYNMQPAAKKLRVI